MKKPADCKTPTISISNDPLSPQRLLYERLSNKWFLMILADLSRSPERFNMMIKRHKGLSQKMLSQTLKNLEEDGMINRVVNGKKMPVEVTYSITDFGLSLIKITTPLFDWSNQNVKKLLTSRSKFEKKYGNPKS